jgi:hypothetical protein
MNLPFDSNTVKELIGTNLALSKNEIYSSFFHPIVGTAFEENGNAKGIGVWETMDGVLRMLDKKGGLVYEFRTLETKNSAVYAVGRNVLSLSRTILHKKIPLSANFGICVSTHINYEKDAIPVLLKSLQKSGFKTDKVLIVVGGDSKNSTVAIDPNFGAKVIRKSRNLLGFTALTEYAHMESSPYWLLLHDTCSVDKDFTSKMAEVDVGLNPDIVLPRPSSERLEIGIYSLKFLKAHMDASFTSGFTSYLDTLTSKTNVAVILNTPVIMEPEKDIYGTGVKRETLLFSSLGILKYRGKAMDGGKP